MIWSQFSAIYDNFRQKIGGFFNVMIKILHNLAFVRVKNANFFAEIIWRKYLKKHNIGPWSPCWQADKRDASV
jgi:hypothetical protein